MPKLPVPVLASPLIRRVVWHVRRVGGQLDKRFFLSLAEGIVVAPLKLHDLHTPSRTAAVVPSA
jgi:hypothetical protein